MSEITGIPSLYNIVEQISKEFQGQVWWRGHLASDWKLLPSVYRLERGPEFETDFSFRFTQRAPSRHSSIPLPDDPYGWLFLMQHYGLPTRLLDWTESPLYATYFAVEDNEYDEEDAALWALSPYLLNQDQIGILGVPGSSHSMVKNLFLRAFIAKSEDENKVAAILPKEFDIRMMVQLSVFTIHGSGLSLNGLENSDKYLKKFYIPSKSKSVIRDQMKLFGVRESNLFPDLEHLAREVKKLKFAAAYGEESNSEDEAVRFQDRPDDNDVYGADT